MLDSRLDLLAFMLCLVDMLTAAVMGLRGLYSPLVWVVGVVFPSVAAYVVGCWVFKDKRPKKSAPFTRKSASARADC